MEPETATGDVAAVASTPEQARVERNVRSLTRSRLLFALLLLVIPAVLCWLFDRQARRLDALGDHGAAATATVTGVRGQGAREYVVYSYSVGGSAFTWSWRYDDAPHGVGETIQILYLPELPSFSRPGPDRASATEEAASNRRLARKVVAGVAVFFAFLTVLCDLSLRKLRRSGRLGSTDARSQRTRLIITGAVLLPLVLLVFGWHARDALLQGQSLWPVVLGAALSLAVLGGVAFYVVRDGTANAARRSARLMRWVVPALVVVAALRLLAWLAGWQ
ncbi:MAG: hypothetical protein ACOY3Y_19855 [Acidobacteriota bacterium]